jgi:hypothetical protein
MELISIDHEKCNKDGICAGECPVRIIVNGPEGGLSCPHTGFQGVLHKMRALCERLSCRCAPFGLAGSGEVSGYEKGDGVDT